MGDIDTDSGDYGDFSAAVASAVATYAGPGSYGWDGITLSFTADADNQSAGDLIISLTAVDDAVVEAAESFSISLIGPSSTTGANVVLGASASVTTTITDNDTATVSIAPATDGEEAGLVNGEFTVTISSPASTDTVINYTLSGTASSGDDYSPLSGQATILAGNTNAMIMFATVDDTLVEGTETVGVTLTGIASGDPEVTLGGTTNAMVNLLDDDDADWSIAGDAAVGEGSNANYSVALNGEFQNGETATVELILADVDTDSSDYADLSVAIATAVTAYSGPGSYSWDGTTLTFTADADNQNAGNLNVSLGANDDVTVEPDEDFSISLSNPGSTTGAAVVLGATTSVTTTINDNDSATVSIAPTIDADENGPVDGVFTVSISSPSATDTVVSYTVTGSATSGSDLTPVSGQVTISGGCHIGADRDPDDRRHDHRRPRVGRCHVDRCRFRRPQHCRGRHRIRIDQHAG